MEKNRNYLLVLFISISVFIGVFYYSVLYSYAGRNAGEEVYFTHTHNDRCYTQVSVSCSSNHTSRHGQEYGDYHCQTCGTTTRHNVEADNCFCSVINASWQENGFAKCTKCGTIHSTWGSGPSGNHTYMVKQLSCKIPEGEKTTGIRITADDNWTNQDLLLQVNSNILKQDITNDNITFSWGGKEKLVGENGTYTVDAVNSAGQTVTASVSIHCIDKTPPVINTVRGDTGNMTQKSIQVSIAASDAESGLAEMAFSFDGGSSYSNSCLFTVVDGSDVVCMVRDKAGNTATKTVKRSDFAYPPTPPPSPAPTPTQTTTSPPSSTATNSTIQTGTAKTETTPAETKTNKSQDSSQKSVVKKSKTNSVTEDVQRSTDWDKSTVKDHEIDSSIEQSEAEKKTKGNMEKEGEVTIYRMKEKNTVPAKATEADFHEEKSDAYADLTQQQIEEPDTAKSAWTHSVNVFLKRYGWRVIGTILIIFSIFWLINKFWIQTVFLYCYNGGEEFRKLGLLRLKKNKKEFTLFLPDYLLDEAETPRYRLLVHKGLVKKYKKMELVLQSEDHKLRQPMEECVDFVL